MTGDAILLKPKTAEKELTKMKGILIVIEGTDGSGKGTQAKLLVQHLRDTGIPSILVSYPKYDTPTGQLIGNFLAGDFGSADKHHPKMVSALFALDRAANKAEIDKALAEGYVVVCDRYVESNIVYQCSELPSAERKNFREWLEDLEYKGVGLTRPDCTFFLDVPPEVSRRLVLEKEGRLYTDKKEDLYESRHDYLKEVYVVFQTIAETSGVWINIPCVTREGVLKTVEEIGDMIYNDFMKYVPGANL